MDVQDPSSSLPGSDIQQGWLLPAVLHSTQKSVRRAEWVGRIAQHFYDCFHGDYYTGELLLLLLYCIEAKLDSAFTECAMRYIREVESQVEAFRGDAENWRPESSLNWASGMVEELYHLYLQEGLDTTERCVVSRTGSHAAVSLQLPGLVAKQEDDLIGGASARSCDVPGSTSGQSHVLVKTEAWEQAEAPSQASCVSVKQEDFSSCGRTATSGYVPGSVSCDTEILAKTEASLHAEVSSQAFSTLVTQESATGGSPWSKRRRLAEDPVTSGTIAASQEVSESFLDRCTDPPEIKAWVPGQVRGSSWTAEDSTSNLAEHEEEVRQEVQRALGVALRKNNLGHCAVGVQADMSRRIVRHVYKAARRLLQQDLSHSDGLDFFVRDVFGQLSRMHKDDFWFCDMDVSFVLWMVWKRLFSDSQEYHDHQARIAFATKYAELVEQLLLDKALWRCASQHLPWEADLQIRLYRALWKSHVQAYARAREEAGLSHVERVECFMRLWLEYMMHKIYSWPRVLQDRVRSRLMNTYAVLHLLEELVVPFGSEHPFSCVPAKLTKPVGRPARDWRFLEELVVKYFTQRPGFHRIAPK